MTQIEIVTFDFSVPAEGFAQGLFSGWEPFCRRCFEQVVDEFFAPYGQGEACYEFGDVELDLGAISEERFYEEYPQRLREELRRAFSFDAKYLDAGDRTSSSRHIDDILFGLKYGCLSETGSERDLDGFFEKETEWLDTQPEAVKGDSVDRLAGQALADDGSLRRMIHHLGSEPLLLRVFASAIAKPDYTTWQKNRFLMSFLDLKGSVPVRFIHTSDGKNDLSRMAELLDSGAVRKIMQIEMDRQSRPGLAFYWHYLYEWLLRYYPYNDVSLFGGKSQFVNHLHLSFLTFIHKRPFLSNLSEYELTVEFLQEVFGLDKYIQVSGAINRLLNQNVGNVARHSRYGESLYLSFMRITLLHQREVDREEEPTGSGAGRPASAESLRRLLLRRDVPEQERRRRVAHFWESYRESYSEAVLLLHSEGLLEAVLALTGAQVVKEVVRQSARRAYSDESLQSVLLVSGWLQSDSADAETVRECLAPVANDDYVREMLASVSLTLLDEILDVKRSVFAVRGEFGWLGGADDDALEAAWNRSVLLWLAGRQTDGPADVAQLLELFCREVTGSGSHPGKEELARRIAEPAGEAAQPAGEAEADGGEALAQLVDGHLPEGARKRILWFYLEYRPWELLHFIRQSAQEGSVPATAWSEWLDVEEWRFLACAISVSAAQTFIRMIESIPLDGRTECRVWAAGLASCDDAAWRFNTSEENVAQFVEALSGHCDGPALERGHAASAEAPDAAPASACHPEQSEESPAPVEEGVSFRIGNAGLCLLAPWLTRLYDRLDYLEPEHKKFRNTYFRVRAVFLLQYLVYGEERRHPESALPFNRLLADIPFNVPLPNRLPLTDEEKQTADGMLAGVKANWPQMSGTSVAGFRRSFVERNGRLKKIDDRWVVVVEENAYDVLLDSVPWGFRQLRLPWINDFVQVVWRNGQII